MPKRPEGESSKPRLPGNKGSTANKSVIKAGDQESVIRPLANSGFQQGREGDKAR